MCSAGSRILYKVGSILHKTHYVLLPSVQKHVQSHLALALTLFSLDESFTDSTSSCSEADSNPDNDYCGRTIAVETRTPSPARGRPRKRSGFNSRVRTRGGRSRGRGTQTRGTSHNLPPNKRLASTISNDEINLPKDPSLDSEINEPL